MAFSLSVALLSGQMVKLGRTLVALVAQDGTRLDIFPTLFSSLCSLGLSEGSVVTAVSKAGPILQSHRKASTFAAIRADGTVVTWGHKFHGGDSRSVRDQLVNVQKIYATNKALAAVKTDGTVVTWGHADQGGDSAAVQEQLQLVKVHQIAATEASFAAMLEDRSDQLQNVRSVHSSSGAFAAIMMDGTVQTWGHALSGGDCRSVQSQLLDVRQIYESNKAFAAVTDGGDVVP
eukprot:Skav233559  [mRNA]  locus=scaffold563:554001:556292:+ [translate_table: standard]